MTQNLFMRLFLTGIAAAAQPGRAVYHLPAHRFAPAHHAPVYLPGWRDLLVNAASMPGQMPQLFGKMRCGRRQQDQQRFQRLVKGAGLPGSCPLAVSQYIYKLH